jgi:hypothetical protein
MIPWTIFCPYLQSLNHGFNCQTWPINRLKVLHVKIKQNRFNYPNKQLCKESKNLFKFQVGQNIQSLKILYSQDLGVLPMVPTSQQYDLKFKKVSHMWESNNMGIIPSLKTKQTSCFINTSFPQLISCKTIWNSPNNKTYRESKLSY